MKPFTIMKKASEIKRNIEVTFTGTPTYFNLTKCITRFDKDFAFGWSLDDSLSDAVKIALPAFKGGNVIEKDGNHLNYPGMFYTDGCGNDIPFNFELKVVGLFISPGVASDLYINYKDFRKVYVEGCNYINHSYSHKDEDADFNNDPTIKEAEIIAEVTDNYNLVKSETGIRMNSFSVPTNYASYFPIAYQMYLNEEIKGLAYMRPDLSTTERQNYNCTSNTMEFYSTLTKIGTGAIRDFDTWQHSTISNTSADVATIDAKLAITDTNNHYWFSAASHRLGVTQGVSDMSSATCFKWLSFKSFFERLASTYGKMGSDNMWMENDMNIWEFIQCYKSYSLITSNVSNTKKNISVDFSTCDPEYRYHSASFILNTDAVVTGITFTNYDAASYKVDYKSLGNGHVLINVQYKPAYEKALYNRLNALVKVETLEFTQNANDKITAQSTVDILLNGSYKTSLQARIDAVTIMAESRTVKIDFGTTSATYDTPVPWNNFKAASGVVVYPNTSLSPLLDMNSNATPFSLTITSGAFTVAAVGNNTAGIYPASAARDSFSTPITTYGELTLSGLDSSKKYDIKVYGNRNSTSSMQKYTVNNVVQTFNIQNNLTTTVDFLNITGVTSIPIRIEGNTSSIIGHLNVLEIIEHT